MKIAIFPGSFDPITKGHEDIVRRALPLFDKIIVALGVNSSKKYMFEQEQRLNFVRATFADIPNIEVDVYQMLTAQYCHLKGAKFILRGVRNSADFEYENTIAQLNKVIGKDIETVFLMTAAHYSFYSSTIVREIIKGGEDPSPFLPAPVLALL